ncbi:MAG: PilT/PilU family type 4a pilus ATPase [Gemmatimonadales bacterium]|nr:PilT/PilU family type 4a pilus ATPase [Gemmatimonadales bacterium]NIN12531.1 PilT/PilU family type 4a pilus ATPase [Gemmatimonadales bacterium]NIN50902.1 PilT/PilU family type 4a pilus ATPase [Gemmatimonadales bacterium]NIP08366.1 PilT/PilU family type 4a pilus ATPase [Gemmatimonadales bacterium]NIR03463.1 PilT/PilU family type 4a pilus ATPase [Gemmatimonadales bacterium]
MPVLDRFISLMFEKDAAALILKSDQQIVLDLEGAQRPVSKDPVPTPKLMGLIKEIMPQGMQPQLDSGDGRLAFGYATGDRRVDVETDRTGVSVTAVLSPAKPRRSTAAISMPAEELLMETASKTEPAAVATPPSPGADQGEERIQELLRHLVESDSSDLHMRVGLPPTYRTHGELKPFEGADPLTHEEIEQMLLAIMPERNKHEYGETNDTDFAYEIFDVARFRANALRDRMGPAAVFRVIPADIQPPDQLGLSPEVQKLCYLTKGLLLVTGPTGSGKSTTLAALVDLINRTRSDHIITIEDPIEFVHPNKKCIVTQRQVGSHTQSFKRALRAALREDPDIVLIGEMRDLETIAIAIETAETGHLVFGTLHTTTAVSTVDRIIDQFPADRQAQIRVMLSESLKGVIAQTLCKKIGGGRVAAHEILLSIGAVSNLIREGKTHQLPSIIQTNKRLGMITLNDSLTELVEKKVIDPQEAYMKSVDKVGLETALKAKGFRVQITE